MKKLKCVPKIAVSIVASKMFSKAVVILKKNRVSSDDFDSIHSP